MSDEIDQDLIFESLGRELEMATEVDKYQLLAKRAKAYRIKRDNRAIGDYIDIVDGATDKCIVCHAQSMLALISIEAQELKEALWWAISALNTNGCQYDARMTIGLVLDASEFHKVAIHYFQSALEIDDSSELAWLKLAISFRETMRFSEADSAFRKLLELSQDNPQYNYECAWNWQLRQDVDDHYDHAKYFYQKALNCNPSEDMRARIERKLGSIFA